MRSPGASWARGIATAAEQLGLSGWEATAAVAHRLGPVAATAREWPEWVALPRGPGRPWRSGEEGEVLAALAGRAASTLPAAARSETARPPLDMPVPPVGVPHHVLLGSLYEACLTPGVRRAGSHYTPAGLAGALCGWCWSDDFSWVLDPSCGAGSFLLAAGERLAASGADPGAVLGGLRGVDVDPGAVAVCEAVLASWVLAAGSEADTPPLLKVGDVLTEPDTISLLCGKGPGLVIGNPPFGGQQFTRTARSSRGRGGRRGELPDTAAEFLALVCDRVPPGTVVSLIQPEGVLANSGTAGLRERLLAEGELAAVWLAEERVFAASVSVWAPLWRKGPTQAWDAHPEGTVALFAGAEVASCDTEVDRAELREAPTWSALPARRRGVPRSRAGGAGVLSEVAVAAAGFRDLYYAVGLALRENSDPPTPPPPSPGADATIPLPLPEVGADDSEPEVMRLVTTGLVGPGRHWWGVRSARYSRRDWREPVVDLGVLADLHPAVHRWIVRQASPKVIVATQARLIEAVTDQEGDLLPLTPLVAVQPRGVPLALISAVLCSPTATAWLAERAGGGLARGHLRATATLVRSIPLPADRDAWAQASRVHERAAKQGRFPTLVELVEAARIMDSAYGEKTGLWEWWEGLMPAADFGTSSGIGGEPSSGDST